MLFSGKENVFICLVAFQKMFRKIFSDVWLCSWKYNRKHIFYLLLTFSHIFLVAKQIYNIIYSSIQKHKQNPEKKNHQIRSNWEKKEEREATGFDKGLRSTRRQDRDRCGASQDRDRRKSEIAIDGAIFLPLRICESFFLSLFLPLRVCELLSLRVSVPEVIWR